MEKPVVVVWVTAERETGGWEPGAVGGEVAERAGDLPGHGFGVQLPPDTEGYPSLRPSNEVYKADCLAEQTGGKTVTTETANELVDALRETLACPVVSFLR